MCIFCNLNFKRVENTIIEEFNNFYVIPAVGSLVNGYLLIISKRHINSMSLLNSDEVLEYEKIIKKYRNIFYDIYGRYPIFFEHGSPIVDDNMKANSVTHAHTHIVNHVYSNESEIIRLQNFVSLKSLRNVKNNNYILYINNDGKKYITYNFEGVSQLMRIYISKDLGVDSMYNWKDYSYDENIKLTVDSFLSYKSSN